MKEKNCKLSVCTVRMHEGLLHVHFVLKVLGLAFLFCGSEVRRLVFMCITAQVKGGY